MTKRAAERHAFLIDGDGLQLVYRATRAPDPLSFPIFAALLLRRRRRARLWTLARPWLAFRRRVAASDLAPRPRVTDAQDAIIVNRILERDTTP